MSKEDCFRPIRGDVWYFATKSVASSSGTSVSYYKGNLGFRLVEEEHTAVEKIVRGSCSEDPDRLSGRVAFDFYNQNLKHENFGFRIVEELG